LGPDYKKKTKQIKKKSTLISNHISVLDSIILVKYLFPAFAPSAEFSKVPVVRTLLNGIDSIYMPRGGTDESRA